MRHHRSRWIQLFGLSIWLGVLSGNAATRIWTGALNTNWAAARNWSNNVLPKANDDLTFPLNPPSRQLWNQLALSFGSIQFLGSYTIGGSPLMADRIGSEGLVTINAPLNLRPNAVADFWEAQIKGTVTLSGDVTFAGHGHRTATSLYGQVTGPGRLLVKEDVALGSSNSYTGGTIILTNGVLILDPGALGVATLGHADGPVEIRSGGCLWLGWSSVVSQPIFAEGAGNAVNGAIQATVSEAKLLRPITLRGDAEIWNGTKLWVAGTARNPDQPRATLIKKGGGALWMLSVTNQFASRVLLSEGNFFMLDSLRRFQGVHPPVAPATFLEELQIGNPSNTFGSTLCDLTLRILDSNDEPLASSVFAPNVAVSVHARSRLTLGPYQKGLGNPLRLFGGSVFLIEIYDNLPAALHSGEIEVSGPVESVITGWLGIEDEVTVRSTDGARLRLSTRLTGGRLTVQGATVSLQGAQQASAYSTLNVASGSVVLDGFLSSVSGGRTNIVGVNNPAAAPAFLGTAASLQFPSPCRIEVHASGSFSNVVVSLLGSLLIAGGSAELGYSFVSDLELRAGARLRFRVTPDSSLSVAREFVWDGDASAEVVFPTAFPSGSPIRLLNRSGNQPIPGRFKGLPDGGTITNGNTLYRINYAGGTGNDLVLEPLAAGPPPNLALSFSPEGQATFSWPEASGCRLEVQWLLNPPGAWTTLVAPPPVDGQYRFLLNVSADQATGFYRLNCP